MYHYVRDRGGTVDGDIRGLGTREFQRQLDDLSDVLQPIDWPTLVAWRAGRHDLDRDSFLLTFDDGLADHVDTVAPILESRGLRGVFFISTDHLADGTMSSAHQVHLLLCRLGAPKLLAVVREALAVEGRSESLASKHASNEAQRLYAYESPERAELKYLLTFQLPVEWRRRMIDELFAEHVGPSREFASHWYMHWEQLVHLQAAGHTIGGHGHEHEPYLRLSPTEQARDMVRCASVLREGLGPEPRPFSYPYGNCDADVARRCAFAGFVNGFTTRTAWVEPNTDAHRLGRVDTVSVGAFMEREFSCTAH